MGLRPAHCYRDHHKPSYTRVALKVQSKNYVGAAPGLRTRQFNMGNPNKKFSHILNLVADEPIQIRDNAIEAVRTAVNHFLNKKLGKESYFMKIRIYPFQILRENKQGQGAGADRTNTGMSHPFGKPIGRAARIRKGKILFSVLVDEEGIAAGKEGLLRAKAKMPCKLHVEIGTGVESIGTKPRRTRDEIAEEKAAKEAEKAAEGKEEEKKEGEKKEEKKEQEEKKPDKKEEKEKKK